MKNGSVAKPPRPKKTNGASRYVMVKNGHDEPFLPGRFSSGLDSLEMYFIEIGKIPRITPKEEISLARRIKRGDMRAREEMINANLRLVVKIAKGYQELGMPLLDLIGEGNMGLMKAVEKFKPGKGSKLSTYAGFWIRQNIMRALSIQSRTIRLPVHVVDTVLKMQKVESRLTGEFQRLPTNEELAAEIGITPQRVHELREANIRPKDLDSPLGNDKDDGTLADLIADERVRNPAEQLELKSELAVLLGLLDNLDKRERTILSLRFGLNDGGGGMSLEEISVPFGVTRERIRQIETKALLKLKSLIHMNDFRKIETCFRKS